MASLVLGPLKGHQIPEIVLLLLLQLLLLPESGKMRLLALTRPAGRVPLAVAAASSGHLAYLAISWAQSLPESEWKRKREKPKPFLIAQRTEDGEAFKSIHRPYDSALLLLLLICI